MNGTQFEYNVELNTAIKYNTVVQLIVQLAGKTL